MKVKRGVSLDGLFPQMYYALGVMQQIFLISHQGDLVITCTKDGGHCPRSLHPEGRAVDIRTRDLGPEAASAMERRCDYFLSPLGFDVVLEADHLHVEYDPHGVEALAEVVH